jgi:hypothetical protein
VALTCVEFTGAGLDEPFCCVPLAVETLPDLPTGLFFPAFLMSAAFCLAASDSTLAFTTVVFDDFAVCANAVVPAKMIVENKIIFFMISCFIDEYTKI